MPDDSTPKTRAYVYGAGINNRYNKSECSALVRDVLTLLSNARATNNDPGLLQPALSQNCQPHATRRMRR